MLRRLSGNGVALTPRQTCLWPACAAHVGDCCSGLWELSVNLIAFDQGGLSKDVTSTLSPQAQSEREAIEWPWLSSKGQESVSPVPKASHYSAVSNYFVLLPRSTQLQNLPWKTLACLYIAEILRVKNICSWTVSLCTWACCVGPRNTLVPSPHFKTPAETAPEVWVEAGCCQIFPLLSKSK